MPDLLRGTVTFLFTDIEGSTRLWEQHPEAMLPALARHDALLRTGIEAHRGLTFKLRRPRCRRCRRMIRPCCSSSV
jgi:class 3 adenylate cyclase